MVQTQESSGKMLKHYKLLKQIGDGQFGIAYLARDTNKSAKDMVCVKVFRELDAAT